MKKISLILTIAVCLVKTHANAQGSLISVDFYNPSAPYYSTPYGPGAAATGNSGDYWNGVVFGSGVSVSGLSNNLGVATSIGYSSPYVSGESGGAEYGGISGTYARLFQCGSFIANTSQTSPTEITGLNPNASYDLFLYSRVDVAGIDVNGVVFTFSGNSGSSPLVNGTGGYEEQVVTADALGNLNLNAVNSLLIEQEISAFQLTPVATPEPSSLALAGLGAASLLAFRRKFGTNRFH